MGKKKSANPLIIGVGIVIVAIAAIPKEVWIGLAVLVLIWLVVRHYGKAAARSAATKTAIAPHQLVQNDVKDIDVMDINVGSQEQRQIPLAPQNPLTQKRTEIRPVIGKPDVVGRVEETLITITVSSSRDDAKYEIPAAPAHVERKAGKSTKAQWIPFGQAVTIAGIQLPGGMLYVGSGLRGNNQDIEPSLVNPNLNVVASKVDISEPLTTYWPSYSSITAQARKAYLLWLAGGRQDPSANIGYVFLFFYGLERRILVDAENGLVSEGEFAEITGELHRLLNIYGDNGSFRGYCTRLLGFISTKSVASKLYLAPSPAVTAVGYELPIEMKVALGQLAVDQQPLAADWALAWALADPNIVRRTPVTRCATQFARLFKSKYTERFTSGLILKVNRTKLRASYHPASAGLHGVEFPASFGGLPDVTAVKGPITKLQQLVEDCSSELDAYSRFLGRNPEKADALDAALLLPFDLWPSELQERITNLKTQISQEGVLMMMFGDLVDQLKASGPLAKDRVMGLARALEDQSLGIEPDVLSGKKAPKLDDKIALFAIPPEGEATRTMSTYLASVVTLDLSCVAALADGEASTYEISHLDRQIESWDHLSNAHRVRLRAHLRLGLNQPSLLPTMKKSLEAVPVESKHAIGRFLAHLAQVDGVVSPGEVKFLEKVYKSLNLDDKLLYSDLHAVPSDVARLAPNTPVATNKAGTTNGFRLDAERIANLQKESEAVSMLLAGVFVEEQPEESSVDNELVEEESVQTPVGIFGLGTDHSAFLRHLVTRHTWSRDDLSDIAADMELMLDGTLEHLNEAMLDMFGIHLAEGSDPIEINQELLEHLPA